MFYILADQNSLDLSDAGLQIFCRHLQFGAGCLDCLLYSCDVRVHLSTGPNNAQSFDLKGKCCEETFFILEDLISCLP